MVDFPYFPMVYPMIPIAITGACRGLYCGCTYDSGEDMERNCPGVTEEEHDEAKSMGLRSGSWRSWSKITNR